MEIYEIVKSVITSSENKTFKIEVLHDQNVLDKNLFFVRVYYQTQTKAEPRFAEDPLALEPIVWGYILHFPSIRRDTIDGAIAAAHSHIEENYKK